jgi:heme-degrading monooxygenase HmoA
MIARATTAEIDTVRVSVEDATRTFRESVLPALHEQEGYEGTYVLLSPEGKALVITFWATEEDAEAGLSGARSFYLEQVEKFVTIFRAPPGRESYEVLVADSPASVTA